ncbi:NADP-dependent 3-hydroxy acid dehydrogenase YdfG [Mucilaginibacter sp. SG538B]|uniref:SDR family oxidoreductase n=1 Tax=Mucilaginibacter sp. SG538B TaxID=2587021 RepID=UPI00159E5B06|nr:SDR family oxidoreductase [Mucilaginibacter sp. SG538B]NVM65294.1 NADP-dependent 3-hydroxy acid dehydrogenase YdfG [Mucilaginibacter sp. SG538B]
MYFNEKIALITGASSGIGRAIAEALNKGGYRLILAARREEKLKELQSEFVDIIPGDLSSAGYQDALVEYIYKTYGKCDYLFNCAGTLHTGTIAETDIDKMTGMLRLNIEATFRLTYSLLKRFKIQGYGHVINLSSVLGTKVRPTAGAYAATKFAIEALSEALRMELAGTDIQVSCIEPGLVMTELHNDWEVHPKDSMQIHEPLNVADVVEAVFYILRQPAHVRIPKLMILPKDHLI